MTESQFSKNIKKWFFGTMAAQIIAGTAWIIYTGGAMSSTVSKNTDDIKKLQDALNQKADVQMVLRIKADQDRIQQMILDNTRELKEGQRQLLNCMLDHLNKTK